MYQKKFVIKIPKLVIKDVSRVAGVDLLQIYTTPRLYFHFLHTLLMDPLNKSNPTHPYPI